MYTGNIEDTPKVPSKDKKPWFFFTLEHYWEQTKMRSLGERGGRGAEITRYIERNTLKPFLHQAKHEETELPS